MPPLQPQAHEASARHAIVDVARRLYDRGLVVASDGNVSVRLPDGNVLITPSGVFKGGLTADQVLLCDRGGNYLRGPGRPSSEMAMHLACYQERPDVQAVVHAHPPTAVGFTLGGVSLAHCTLPEVIISLGDIPTAAYATPTTYLLPEAIREHVRGHDAVLMERHGAVTLGADPYEAFHRMEQVEHTAKISFVARMVGQVTPLPTDDVKALLEIRGRFRGGSPASIGCNYCGACTGTP
ncbi:MAG: class II aldolase/adducin family protein [Planctomycetes bacterium]|nr:class II aldolase/adducin family protein [Planctomycetota bacterium]